MNPNMVDNNTIRIQLARLRASLPAPPQTPPPDLDAIPAALRADRRIVFWNWKEVRGSEDKWTKIPHRLDNGHAADATDPATWGEWAEYPAAALRHGCAGIGRVLAPGDGYTVIDLDDCIDKETGALTTEAQAIVAHFNSYTEISPSGEGVKIWIRGTLPAGKGGLRDDDACIEVYSHSRYLTLTGWHLAGTPATVEARQGELDAFFAQRWQENEGSEATATTATTARNEAAPARRAAPFVLADATVIRLACGAENGEKFRALYRGDLSAYGGNESRADLAYFGVLKFYTQDRDQLSRLYENSPYYQSRPDRQAKWQRVDGAGRLDYRDRTLDKVLATRGTMYGDDRDPFTFDDAGNANRFARDHKGRVAYCGPWETWLIYDGTRWVPDQSHAVQQRALDTIERMESEAVNHDDEDEATAQRRWAASSRSAFRITNLLKLARSHPDLIVTPDQFDRDGLLLNGPDGTLDLRTGELRPHDPADWLTKRTNVVCDPAAVAPQWAAFLDRILVTAKGNRDEELQAFVQVAIGLSLIGGATLHKLFLALGDGANGKSTLLETIGALLGDYAMQAAPNLLMRKRHASHPTELADLFGKRFVTSIEPDDGTSFDEALVKQLTGGDTIRARRMRENFWQFAPTHTIWMSMNHMPVVRGTDNGIWRRLTVVPFNARIPEAEQDGTLREKLATENAGILAWAVAGCQVFLRTGRLPDCAAVATATKGYRDEMDTVGAWIDGCIRTGAVGDTSKATVYESYSDWCKASGIVPLSMPKLSRHLEHERNWVAERSGTTRYWRGVSIIGGTVVNFTRTARLALQGAQSA